MKTTVQKHPCTWLMGCCYAGGVCQTTCRCWESLALLCDFRPQHAGHSPGLSSAYLHGTRRAAHWFWVNLMPTVNCILEMESFCLFPVQTCSWSTFRPTSPFLFLLDLYTGNIFLLSHEHFLLNSVWTQVAELLNVSQMRVMDGPSSGFRVEKMNSHTHPINT